MMTLEEIKIALHDRRLTVVSAATGLSYDTVWRIANKDPKAASYSTIKALSDYIESTCEVCNVKP